MNIHWFEFKFLDKSTNHVSRTEMLKQICRQSHKIKYYCGYKKGPKQFPGISSGVINYLPSPDIPKIRGLFLIGGMMAKILDSLFFKKPDVIIIDYVLNLFCFPFFFLSRYFNSRTKIVLDVRTLPVNVESYHRDIKVFLFSLSMAHATCHGITFITPFMGECCSKKTNLRGIKISYWTSGFNPELFYPVKKEKEENERFVIFYHGGISISRGIGALVEAVRILRDEQLPIFLTLIGNLVDEARVREKITKNGLEEVVNILPPVPYEQIPSLIGDCDLPVIPLPDFMGWRVSSPIKLMEYLAMGKPVVLTDIEAHTNVVGKRDFAFFAPTASPKDLASAIKKAYEMRERFEEWEKPAKTLALENYTWEKQAQRLLNFIKEL